ncbi:BTB domain-containing protein [Sergentomyia squamirostris]
MPINLEIQPNAEEVWNKERGPVIERLSYFVNNEFLSDMTFVVGRGEEKTRVPGHRFILSTCSWEFYNALYLLQLDNDEIPIEDADLDSFLTFLKYCYTGKIALYWNVEETVTILKLAHRFHMEHLIESCETHITEVNTGKNCICWYKECNFLPKESKLRSCMLSVIARNFWFCIQDQSQMELFKDLPLKDVREIVSNDQLTCDEMQLFDALMKWASHNCEKMNIPENPINLRIILKDVFYKIRFPNMNLSFIFLHILSQYPNLFSAKEISQLGLKIRGDLSICEDFSIIPRRYDTQEIKSFIDLSVIGKNVHPCFSNSLKLEGTSRYFSTHFKFSADAGDHILTEIALVVRRDQVFKLCYYYICVQKRDEKPIIFGPYTTRPKGQSVCTQISIGPRYQINWDYDLVFLRFQKFWNIRKDLWHRLYCEFDTELPYSHPDDPDNSTDSSAQFKIWKDKIALIPYLCAHKIIM